MRIPSFRIIDHSADLGFEVLAATPQNLFRNAAHVLFSLMWDITRVREKETLAINVDGEDLGSLLVIFLNEFPYLFDAKGLLFHRVLIEDLSKSRLSARAFGETFDPGRHETITMVKAVTYHQLFVGKEGRHYKARVILDI